MSTRLNKELYSNLRSAVNDALERGWITEIDTDSNEAIFEQWDSDHDCYNYFKQAFNYDGQKAEFVGEPVEVVIKTSIEIVKSKEDRLVDKVLKAIASNFSGSAKVSVDKEGAPVLKQLEDEQMIAIEPLYIAPDEIDGHGDTMSLEEIYKMVDSFNAANDSGSLLSNYDHEADAEGNLIATSDFKVLKAWVSECDCYIGEHFIPEGQPLVKTQFTDADKWAERKSGELKGVSIGAKATCIEVEDE